MTVKRYIAGAMALSSALCISLSAFAQSDEDDGDNGLPQVAPASPDGKFVFVPLIDPSVKTVSAPVNNKATKPRVVLALGGGGMRGAAHVGVLKELVKAGVPIDGIAGTSMGSIVGGMYAAGMPLDEIETRFVNGSLMKSFVPVSPVVRILIAPITSLPRLFGRHPYDGLYFGGVFHKYLDKALPADHKQIESLRIPFCAVAIDLCDGHTYAIRKGSLVSAMQASSAVPGLRKPIAINDKLFVDGGVLANVPVPHARSLGGDIVIAVQIDEHFKPEPQKNFTKIGSVARRMVKLQLAALDSFHERNADLVIHPNVDGVGLISTKISDAKSAIAAGEAAARNSLPAIKAKLNAAGIASLQQTQ